MKCPFLEEILVQYCTACPVKKMLPKDRLIETNPCEANYNDCPIYKEFLAKEEKFKKERKMAEINEKENLCIWAKAGVISYRICTSDYDCKNCAFDQALSDASGGYVESPMVIEAIKKLKQLPAGERKCRYMLTGDFTYKLCSNNYECWHCAVDQYIQDMIEANPYLRRRREREAKKEKKIKGFAFREDYYYTPNHIWLKFEGELVKVGIDDFAAKIIGKIDDIKFSENRLIKSGEQWLQIGSGNRIAKMRLPMAIEIVEANEIVKSQPGLVTKDPHNLGWLLKIKPPKEIGEFRKGDNAKDWLEKEFDRLHQEFEQSIGLTIADGGEIASDLYERLSDEQWHGLVKKFLE
ncbi:MAG: glycine cleavage system protein H [candidate division WOR-3 bacterium]